MKLDPQTLEALARVAVHEPKVVDWLVSRAMQNTSILVSQKDEVSVRWAQGRVQECDDIVETIRNAADILRKASR